MTTNPAIRLDLEALQDAIAIRFEPEINAQGADLAIANFNQL